MLLIGLCFAFLFWKLRRLAGMVTDAGRVRPKVRRAAVIKVAKTAVKETPPAGVAAQIVPAIPEPSLPPPQEQIWPADEPPKPLPYGAYLLRLIQNPEMRALLEAAPHLKSSLRRLLRLLGEDLPSQLAPTPRPPCLPRPKRPKPSAAKRNVFYPLGLGQARNSDAGREWPFSRWPRAGPPQRLQSAWIVPETCVHFVSI